MKKGVDYYIDSVVPRGFKNQPNIFVNLEEYLTRLANLNSKYIGVKHRKEQWDNFTAEHISSFNEKIKGFENLERNLNRATFTKSIMYRDIRVENEFEMILYSISCTLSALSKVISSFLKGKTKLHSHNSLAKTLKDNTKFSTLAKIVQNAVDDWVLDLKHRRDAATHYIPLLLKSKLEQKQKKDSILSKSRFCLAIPKTVQQHISVWEADVPVIGGMRTKSTGFESGKTKKTKHEILDKSDKLIFRSESAIGQDIDFIDSIEYINNICNKLEKYIIEIFKILKTKLV